MKLITTLQKPVWGYWDGGKKDTFEWIIDPTLPGKGKTIVGSWEANYWFEVKTGKTERQTLSHALRSISASLKRKGLEFNYQYID